MIINMNSIVIIIMIVVTTIRAGITIGILNNNHKYHKYCNNI